MSELARRYSAGAPVVHSGDVPHGNAWQQLTGNHGDKTVIHEEGSKNENWTDIAGAVALAGKPLTPGTTRVFNALPQEREHTVASQRERHRMGIGGSSQAWSDVNERIARETKGFRTEVAHKQALL